MKQGAIRGVLALMLAGLVLLVVVLGIYLSRLNARKSEWNLQSMKISRITQSGNAVNVAISPDGRYVVYALREGEKQSLNVRQVATGSDVQILPPDEVVIWSLVFSPDGNYIDFVRSEKTNMYDTFLYRMPVLGGTPRLVMQGGIDGSNSYSPDGTQFAFLRVRPETEKIDLLIAKADGTDERVARDPSLPRLFFRHGMVSRRKDDCILNLGGGEDDSFCALGRVGRRRICPRNVFDSQTSSAVRTGCLMEEVCWCRILLSGTEGTALVHLLSKRRCHPTHQRPHELRPLLPGPHSGWQNSCRHRADSGVRSVARARWKRRQGQADHREGARYRTVLLDAQRQHRLCQRRWQSRCRKPGWKWAHAADAQ